MDIFRLDQGAAPLLISLPHDGSHIPADIAARMHPAACRSRDTDWHVARLYAPLAQALGASLLRPIASRYVVDLNRPADGHALYPGRKETGLVSTVGFDGEPLYLDDASGPDEREIRHRVETYWRPYHEALQQELARLLGQHGRVVLWEGHSIRSRVPMLFDGRLPDLNLGTADGASCSPGLQQRLQGVLGQSGYSYVVNGRFKGGYITRQYGRADRGVDAVQLELAQCTYMDEDSFAWDETRAQALRLALEPLLRECVA
jgi:N-formylglutamate deformylase